jgi:hypothetical protein
MRVRRADTTRLRRTGTATRSRAASLRSHLTPQRVQAPEPEEPTPEQRHRQAGGPQDRALYTCGCGMQFTADVTTSVGCPHCGTSQAW